MNERLYADLGVRIRSRREGLRMTQAELAARIGLSRASVANIEGGRQAVLLHQLLSVAEALGVRPVDLIPSSEPGPIPPVARADLPDGVRRFVQSVQSTARAGRKAK